jgi:hypothetical protein
MDQRARVRTKHVEATFVMWSLDLAGVGCTRMVGMIRCQTAANSAKLSAAAIICFFVAKLHRSINNHQQQYKEFQK